MQRRKWIVVGTDFSPGAARAVERAAELATETGASLACVHAYEDPPGTPLLNDASAAMMADLERSVAATRRRYPTVAVECFVRRGPAWDKLANVACELGAELIVVGARGQHGRAHPSLLGSVTTRIASTSHRSVVIVPASDEDHDPSTARGSRAPRRAGLTPI